MSRSAPVIRFHFLFPFDLPERKRLKQAVLELVRKEGRQLESVDFIFCSDEYLLKLNQDFLQHDDYTDIITFDLTEHNSDAMAPLNAEIYISVERVRENAISHQVPFLHEVYRVIFHGLLHLCGYQDKTGSEKAAMKAKEDEYLNSYLAG